MKHLGLRIYKRSSEVVGMLCNMSKKIKNKKTKPKQNQTRSRKKHAITCKSHEDIF